MPSSISQVFSLLYTSVISAIWKQFFYIITLSHVPVSSKKCPLTVRPRLLNIVFHSSIIKELTSDVKYYFYFISIEK